MSNGNGENDRGVFPVRGHRPALFNPGTFYGGFDHFPVRRKNRRQADVPRYCAIAIIIRAFAPAAIHKAAKSVIACTAYGRHRRRLRQEPPV